MQKIVYWNVNPEIFHFGFLSVRWYGLLFAMSFLVGSVIGNWVFKRENKPSESLDRLLLYMLVGTILGARLGDFLFYRPLDLIRYPLEVFQIWKGGLASHGAAVGIFTALFVYSKRTPGQSYIWVLDRVAIVVALSGFFIRLGNLFNSEIIGQPTRSTWGFVFQRIDAIPRHPAQLYESLTYLLIFFVLFAIYVKRDPKENTGVLVGTFLILVFGSRFFIEFVKENQVTFESGLTLNMGQMLSVPLVLLGLTILIGPSLLKNNRSQP
ncbi:MAG: prolipoprotein diacylglyceryl transferase [Proteobacteria bacterium]|nr:prolipoprotein diacylglyceryl transferase [Pseudomonadota bacterium]